VAPAANLADLFVLPARGIQVPDKVQFLFMLGPIAAPEHGDADGGADREKYGKRVPGDIRNGKILAFRRDLKGEQQGETAETYGGQP
jgi:hypothetical protein